MPVSPSVEKDLELGPRVALPSASKGASLKGIYQHTVTHNAIMDRLVLTLAIRWLEASDAFSASCVCREWQASLSGDRDGGDVWKQVLKNTHPLVHAQVRDYRRLALGFGRSIAPAPPELTFSPSIRFEDLFAVVDLYRTREVGNRRRRVIEASWTCPVTPQGIKMSNDSKRTFVKGLNPYSVLFVEDGGSPEKRQVWKMKYSPPLPQFYALDDVTGLGRRPWFGGRVQARVTLFRRDNMKSVCLMDQFIGDYDNKNLSFCPETMTVGTGFEFSTNLHFATDDAGRTAQLLMFNHGFARTIRIIGEFHLEWVPPPDEETAWFTNMRDTLVEGRLYEPNLDDLDALSRIPHFEFEVKYLSFGFSVAVKEGSLCQSLPPDEMMVALEGLCWQ